MQKKKPEKLNPISIIFPLNFAKIFDGFTSFLEFDNIIKSDKIFPNVNLGHKVFLISKLSCRYMGKDFLNKHKFEYITGDKMKTF